MKVCNLASLPGKTLIRHLHRRLQFNHLKYCICMTKTFMAIIAVSLVSCGTAEKEAPKEEAAAATTTTEAAPAVATVTNLSGYTPAYSASFSIGDVKNAETVLALYKSWDSETLDPLKGSFSDSVTFYLADGSMIAGRRDTAIASMQAYRNG